MCFFHVVENVKKRVLSLSKNSKYLVYRRIYEMHYARDATEFMSIQERADGFLIDTPYNVRNAEEDEQNNRRMERLGQPMLGWTVNLNSQTCRCRAFYRFGACMLAPLKRANWKIAGWPETERR
ncbi:hypothetical protein PPTG_21530 [Phytophthora nicotianae INRA-310]|uniref:MULE transposase domain-containing protein n=1 Tax=Phytophthora nicotianae (strain INRA-310) TaxID=761204 RepID=W2QYE1_PHYN3|nr:hypothetical protein PPTG_21530 [Phytophthora nicotianae INRA-310]ETN18148.1 hypothetical protein PPTG_21530 [Phytophthora nicotianae INRA-310]